MTYICTIIVDNSVDLWDSVVIAPQVLALRPAIFVGFCDQHSTGSCKFAIVFLGIHKLDFLLDFLLISLFVL